MSKSLRDLNEELAAELDEILGSLKTMKTGVGMAWDAVKDAGKAAYHSVGMQRNLSGAVNNAIRGNTGAAKKQLGSAWGHVKKGALPAAKTALNVVPGGGAVVGKVGGAVAGKLAAGAATKLGAKAATSAAAGRIATKFGQKAVAAGVKKIKSMPSSSK